MADADKDNIAATHDYNPSHGSKRDEDEILKRDKPPTILYDDRSTYRQNYTNIGPPYSDELPWKPNEARLTGREVRGSLPGFFGPAYTDPYSRLNNGGHVTYESSGAERMKQDIAEELEQQRIHGKAIPAARITLPEEPVEKFTEYRSVYCKTVDGQEPLPDVKPMAEGLYKYYQGEDNFSYNSQHRNKAY
ncbi:uncharacterized protein [Watersipora subatra]|uniref:uncharacterized protein n=1 Tax=Watersipora subatra TaxID=2589382 RepID=UPI00355C40F1